MIDCIPMNARLTPRGCLINQHRAIAAMRMLDDGVSVFLIDTIDLDRMMCCWRCENATVAIPDQYVQRVKSAIRTLWTSTEDTRWWAGDPEMVSINARARQKRWRDRHKADTAEYKKMVRLKRQIKDMEGEKGGEKNGK